MVESSPIFADGFGRRVVRVSRGDTPPTEHLLFDPVLAGHDGFAAALRERVAKLHGRRLTSYVRVLAVDDGDGASLGIVSEYARGWRLADLLDVAESENLTFDIGVVMLLLRQLLPTAALLGTQAKDTASGALGPEHLLLTPQARLVLSEYVLGSAIDALGWTPDRLWRTLRVATPAGSDKAVSARGDVVQVGVTVLSLIVGRRLRDDEYPERLEDLVTSARQKTPSVIHAPLSAPLRDWLLRALQIAPKPFATLFDAQMALERLLTAEPSLLAQPAELENAVARFARFMPEFELPQPEAELPLLEAPPAGSVPMAVAFDRPASAKVEAPEPVPQPEPVAQAAIEPEPEPAPSPKTKSGVRRKADKKADKAAERAAQTSTPAHPVADEADDTDEGFGPVLPLPPAAHDVPPPAHPHVASAMAVVTPAPVASADTVSAPEPPASAQVVPFPVSTPANTYVRPEPAPVAESTDSYLPPPTPELPLWQSTKFVAALVALAVAQTLTLGWMFTRPSQGLGGDGEVVVQSRPEGAKVLIDDKEQGVTPLTVKVSPGTHVLQVRAGTAEPRVIPLLVRPGTQTAQYVELMGVASTGALQVRSEPSKAKVSVDGQDRGSTPLTLRDLAPREYQVVLERAGWKSTQVVRVEAGATAQLVVPLR